MTLTARLRIDSTNVLDMIGLHDETADPVTYPIDALVVATLLDQDDVPVPGAVGVALAYVPGTVGADTTYRAILSHLLVLRAAPYTARVTVTVAGDVATFDLLCLAYRQRSP